VRYALHVPVVEKAHACHCRMCQRATGGAFALLAGAPRSKFEWTRGEPALFASSSLADRGFCRDCGTPLTFAYRTPEARLYVTIGSLDHPELAPLEVQYGIESKLPWVEFCEHTPAERTGESDDARAFFAGMTVNQS
jgi:hypothetical protein